MFRFKMFAAGAGLVLGSILVATGDTAQAQQGAGPKQQGAYSGQRSNTYQLPPATGPRVGTGSTNLNANYFNSGPGTSGFNQNPNNNYSLHGPYRGLKYIGNVP